MNIIVVFIVDDSYIANLSLVPQAIIFWVVDNFLMRKGLRRTHHHQHHTLHPSQNGGAGKNGSTVKYYKASSKLRYYDKNRLPKDEESDSDVLLTHEELSLDNGDHHNPSYGHTLNGGRYHLLEATAPV